MFYLYQHRDHFHRAIGIGLASCNEVVLVILRDVDRKIHFKIQIFLSIRFKNKVFYVFKRLSYRIQTSIYNFSTIKDKYELTRPHIIQLKMKQTFKKL